MTTFGYVRVSSDSQDQEGQKLAIYEFCQQTNKNIDEWYEMTISSRKSTKKRKIDDLVERFHEDDLLIVSELSRLARSVGQIAIIVDKIIEKGVNLISIKEDIKINGTMNIQTKTMVTMFSLFAEIERDLISIRTKEGLRVAREKGKLLGRPPGSRKLAGKEEFIVGELKYGVPAAAIARKLGCGRDTLTRFIKEKNLKAC
ncbi:MAG: recombinase family protein [Deltaproteobacteria bacterium]|jgi:DNA invertase Pin-like site-specific DNA recombinase|nr:recombinase family protein [Deltaproteobacteria bacterium]